MANSSLALTSLDFNTLKSNFVNYLKSQTIFKDYDFNDSNLNVLLDVLSYNSFLNSFYLNMTFSEMFLDSAQKIDSVISHAKELNYIPKSYTSSAANIAFTVTASSNNLTFVIPKGTLFTGYNSNGAFSFTTPSTTTYTSSNNTFSINNLQIFEGIYQTDSFTIDYTQESQRFILSNPNVDLNSLTVNVVESTTTGITNTVFSRVSTLYGLNSGSNVYFIQASSGSKYEIVFGDGLLGRLPINLSTVIATYRVSSGTDSDGVSIFNVAQDLGVYNGTSALVSSITTSSNSSGGSNTESIESIRFSAPRYFATQQRAISSDDYKSLILTKFQGIIGDVSIYGGETLPQKQYGRVVVALKPNVGTIAPDYIKNQITTYLNDFIALPNRIIVTDPDYLYLKVDSTVFFNQVITTYSSQDIQSLVSNTINSYAQTYLNTFSDNFKYSNFIASIDNTDASIVSNETEVSLIKRLTPLLNYASSFTINFNNTPDAEATNPLIGYNSYSKFSDEPVLFSSPFTYTLSGVSYPNSYIRDDNVGNVIIFSDINGVFTVLNSSLGTIDYSTGLVTINNLKVSDYGSYLSLYLRLLNKNVSVSSSQILLIDPNDVTITVKSV